MTILKIQFANSNMQRVSKFTRICKLSFGYPFFQNFCSPNFILEDIDEALDGLLLLDEVLAEAGRVDHGEEVARHVAQPMARVGTGGLGHARAAAVAGIETHDLESRNSVKDPELGIDKIPIPTRVSKLTIVQITF